MTDTNLKPRDEESANRLKHFEATNAIYHKELFKPNFETVTSDFLFILARITPKLQ